ncbi:hypothetical protein VOLCADRAFT_120774 [Volvox carteri f. nagariensis]|uniref:C2HC zinc finger plants domain-containing protein n=1 Tax=Volvox carteri f. nagariensis TaxID=3068 RepID=D8TTA8_VOLCA|nr:uncharacterized protein VOLCADRAFT_120774 [Volvox carteri f. nagariensis]EFJ49166.1 hypothetical protein VOLCADRAFT_120774 [Volvox carteri f. nagariensis]|eukprot:XP_002949614.1 hypothetical protein VOLCADRAFT_120774 [Volvox carteri f. nagariensis]
MNAPSDSNDAAVQGLLREAYTAVANGDPTQALRLVLAALHATGGQAAAAPALNRVLTHLTADNQGNALQELTELFARAATVRGEDSTPQAPPSGIPPVWPSPPSATPHLPMWRGTNLTCPAVPHASISFPPCPGGEATRSGDTSSSMSCSGNDLASTSASMDTEGAGGGAGRGGAVAVASVAGEGGGGGGGGGQEATSTWVGHGLLGGLQQRQAPILSETGREGFMECALQDGSSYVCARCRGVVLVHRRQQHEQYWCPRSGAGG